MCWSYETSAHVKLFYNSWQTGQVLNRSWNIAQIFGPDSFSVSLQRSLNFRKFKVALNPMYRNFLNFAKSCVLSCLSKVDNIKKFHRAVFEL